jgi:hypothetical protein
MAIARASQYAIQTATAIVVIQRPNARCLNFYTFPLWYQSVGKLKILNAEAVSLAVHRYGANLSGSKIVRGPSLGLHASTPYGSADGKIGSDRFRARRSQRPDHTSNLSIGVKFVIQTLEFTQPIVRANVADMETLAKIRPGIASLLEAPKWASEQHGLLEECLLPDMVSSSDLF